MLASTVLKLLLEASDKAAMIASIIRKEKPLLDLLIQEKKSIEKNNEFFQDFKTLADVLIQETVRHDLSQAIPDIASSIYGEESNRFTNAKGESIVVEVGSSEMDTQNTLNIVLNGNEEASQLLAQAVHSSGNCPSVPHEKLNVNIPTDECGIWIDPIDATGQYIKGKLGKENEDGLVVDGLQCVAVLIGMFQKSSGKPIIGVIVQPFAEFDSGTESWSKNTIWGVHFNGANVTSFEPTSINLRDKPKIILSKSESENVQRSLSKTFDLTFASGAGYKLLTTVLGYSNCYVLSHRSIYRWDCCAVHAVLCAIGGGIISYKHSLQASQHSESALTEQDLAQLQVSYIKSSGVLRNRKNSYPDDTESLPGIIAYRSLDDALAVLTLLT